MIEINMSILKVIIDEVFQDYQTITPVTLSLIQTFSYFLRGETKSEIVLEKYKEFFKVVFHSEQIKSNLLREFIIKLIKYHPEKINLVAISIGLNRIIETKSLIRETFNYPSLNDERIKQLIYHSRFSNKILIKHYKELFKSFRKEMKNVQSVLKNILEPISNFPEEFKFENDQIENYKINSSEESLLLGSLLKDIGINLQSS